MAGGAGGVRIRTHGSGGLGRRSSVLRLALVLPSPLRLWPSRPALPQRPAPCPPAANQPLGAGKGRAWAPEGAVPPPPRLPGLLLVPWGSWTVSRIQCSAHSFVNVD